MPPSAELDGRVILTLVWLHLTSVGTFQPPPPRMATTETRVTRRASMVSLDFWSLYRRSNSDSTPELVDCIDFPCVAHYGKRMYTNAAFRTSSNSIGGLVVKLAVAIRDLASQMIRPAPGSIPGRCILLLECPIFCTPFFENKSPC